MSVRIIWLILAGMVLGRQGVFILILVVVLMLVGGLIGVVMLWMFGWLRRFMIVFRKILRC
jgi:hypothetical protein